MNNAKRSDYDEAYNAGVDRVIEILSRKFGINKEWLNHVALDLDQCDCGILVEDEVACRIFNPPQPPSPEHEAMKAKHEEQVRALRQRHIEEIARYREAGLLP